MSNGQGGPGEWGRSGPIELPAVTLRRAISHVEALLRRYDCATDVDGPTLAEALSALPLATVTPISAAARSADQARAMCAAVHADNETRRPCRPHAEAERLIADARSEAAAIVDTALREAGRLRRAAVADRENTGLSPT